MTGEFVIAIALETAVFVTAILLWVGWGVLYKVCQDSVPAVRLIALGTGLIWVGVIVGLVYAFTIS